MNVNGQSGTPKRSIPMVVLHCYEIGYQIKSRAARLPIYMSEISWGVAPGYINIAPLGLEGSYLSYERFLKPS